MKAWVLEDVGDIQYKEAAKPHISENEKKILLYEQIIRVV